MKHKYTLTIEIESDKALKAVDKTLIQEHRIGAFVEPRHKATNSMPYFCINWLDLKKVKNEGGSK